MTRRQEGWCVTGARRICERMRSLPHPTYMSTRVIHVRLFASLVLYLYNIHVHIWHTCPLVSHLFASIIQYMSISTIHSIHVHLCHTCSVVRIVGIVLIHFHFWHAHPLVPCMFASNIQYEFIVYLVYFVRTNHTIHVHPCHTCSHPWYCTYTCSYPKYMSTCSLVSYILHIHIKRMFTSVHMYSSTQS